MLDPLHAHTLIVADELVEGRVTPFLGAGVNRFGRLAGDAQPSGSTELPDGQELASHLATRFHFSLPEGETPELLRIAQWVTVMLGSLPLYRELHEIFSSHYVPNPLHAFFATFPARLARRVASRGAGNGDRAPAAAPYPLIVTTNYDDALEQAFDAVKEPYDLIWYIADGEDRGRFRHRAPDGAESAVVDPTTHGPDLLESRTVILKIHGAVNRTNEQNDSYVITEDDYIDYLARSDISKLVPANLRARLLVSHILFLGYSMRDWNLRAFLHRIWSERKRNAVSWAIQTKPDQLDQEFWSKRDVQILDVLLEDYVARLDDLLPLDGDPS